MRLRGKRLHYEGKTGLGDATVLRDDVATMRRENAWRKLHGVDRGPIDGSNMGRGKTGVKQWELSCATL
jgi:hypothetical protein